MGEEEVFGDGVGGGEEAADDGAAVAIVAADHGICGESGGEIFVVFPSEVEGGGHSVVDVAGGAISLADHNVVVLFDPGVSFVSGEPIASFEADGFVEIKLINNDGPEETGEGVGGADDVGVRVGERDVEFDNLAEFVAWHGGEGGDEGGDGGEPADVFIADPAFAQRFALGVAGEEAAM